jgi:hypothetical protein
MPARTKQEKSNWTAHIVNFIGFCAVAAVIVMTGCEDVGKANDNFRKNWIDDHVQEVQKEIVYFKDHRTGLCYGFWWGGYGHGGPAMTLVPEAKVKQFLVNP